MISRMIAIASLVAFAGAAAGTDTTPRDTLPAPEDLIGCGKAQVFRSLAEAGLNPMGGSQFPAGIAALSVASDTDVTHVDLELETDFNNLELAGTCTTDITSLVNGLSEYTFRLRSQYNVSSVTVDGVPASWSTLSTTTKSVTLPVAKDIGESFQLEVVYDGPTVSGFFGSIEWINASQGPWWVNDDMVYTLSQPYYAYTWWPAKDGDVGDPCDYADKFTLDFSIIAPSSFTSTANGVLTGIDNLSGNRQRYNFHTDYELPTYLVAFATSTFNTYTQNWNYGPISMPVVINLTTGNDSATARSDWFGVIPMLTAFSDRYGTYPFANEKYGLYEFGFGGGMEHQTNTGQLAAPGYTGIEWLTAHEVMHQWLGDWVTCRTWHDIWINEGGASYGEALWEEEKFGAGALQSYQMNDNFPGNLDGTVYVYDTSDPNRIFNTSLTYLKASWVYHMLRGVLGDTAYFQGVQDFISWYGGSAATTEDFKAAFEASSGVDLERFIEQWVYQGGAMRFARGYRVDTVNGQNYLRLRLRQTQPGSDAGGQPFDMPVDVRVNGSDDYSVRSDEYDEHFVIPIPGGVSSVAIDPDDWILKRGSTANEAYANGPPVVVATADSPTEVEMTFVEPVNLADGDFSVVTADVFGTPVPFLLSYHGATNTATLDFGGSLPGGDYLVTAFDTIDAQASGIALDGEGALPSGDGLAGGDFSFVFNVPATCPADLNGDGILDNGDISQFIVLFLAGDLAVDFNGDGILDNGDISEFVIQFLAGC